MPDFSIKRNDTEPPLKATLEDGDGDPVDVSGATVTFHMKESRSGQTVVDKPATLVNDGEDGQVKYSWDGEDTEDAGEYDAEFEVEYGAGGVETFPNSGFLTVEVDEDIA